MKRTSKQNELKNINKKEDISLNDSQFLIENEKDSENVETNAEQANKSKITLENGSTTSQKDTSQNFVTNTQNIRSLSSWDLPESILDKYKSRGLTSMFHWQAECLSNPKVLLENKNLVYSAPTSAGKTLVAEILALKTVIERKKKVIIILPFVSVVREKMFYFQDILSANGIRVAGFMGSYHPPGGFKTVNLAICTIEKANGIINRLLEDGLISEIGAVIIDEMHLLGDPSRGYLLELLLTKLKYMTSKNDINIQLIGMSATLPNLDLLAKWLNAELYTTDFRPIPLQEFCMFNGEIYNNKLKLERKLKPSPDLKEDTDHILQICLETISESCSVLIFCPTKNWCENLAQQIAVAFLKLGRSQTELGQCLRDQLSVELITETLEQLQRCPVGLDHILKKTISFAVAFHHAGLTMDERDIIEGAFRCGSIRVLVATSTLSSGVNLPARRVIIRTPTFHGKPIDTLTYRQMIGRAGRMGKDIAGESILICQKNDKYVAAELMSAHLQPIESCLEGAGKLKRAILEVIASGVASSVEDVNLFTNCTLLANSQEFETDPITKAIDFLRDNEFIRLQTNDNNELHYVPTSLAKACLSSSLPPEDGLDLFEELEKARRSLCLDTELHLLYLVTPYSVCNQWTNLDWMSFLNMWEKLPACDKRVADLVGVKESFIFNATRGKLSTKTAKMYHKVQIHRRFYTALALHDLVNEVSLNDVASKFQCSRGMLQSLQQSASTFAGMVTAFSKQLGWSCLEILISQFQDRLQFGIHHELLELMKLPLLNGPRARTLYNADIKTLVDLASCDVCKLENILYSAIPFQSDKEREGETAFDVKEKKNLKSFFITGQKGLTAQQAAIKLIQDARLYLQDEMGAQVNWDKPLDDTISDSYSYDSTSDDVPVIKSKKVTSNKIAQKYVKTMKKSKNKSNVETIINTSNSSIDENHLNIKKNRSKKSSTKNKNISTKNVTVKKVTNIIKIETPKTVEKKIVSPPKLESQKNHDNLLNDEKKFNSPEKLNLEDNLKTDKTCNNNKNDIKNLENKENIVEKSPKKSSMNSSGYISFFSDSFDNKLQEISIDNNTEKSENKIIISQNILLDEFNKEMSNNIINCDILPELDVKKDNSYNFTNNSDLLQINSQDIFETEPEKVNENAEITNKNEFINENEVEIFDSDTEQINLSQKNNDFDENSAFFRDNIENICDKNNSETTKYNLSQDDIFDSENFEPINESGFKEVNKSVENLNKTEFIEEFLSENLEVKESPKSNKDNTAFQDNFEEILNLETGLLKDKSDISLENKTAFFEGNTQDIFDLKSQPNLNLVENNSETTKYDDLKCNWSSFGQESHENSLFDCSDDLNCQNLNKNLFNVTNDSDSLFEESLELDSKICSVKANNDDSNDIFSESETIEYEILAETSQELKENSENKLECISDEQKISNNDFIIDMSQSFDAKYKKERRKKRKKDSDSACQDGTPVKKKKVIKQHDIIITDVTTNKDDFAEFIEELFNQQVVSISIATESYTPEKTSIGQKIIGKFYKKDPIVKDEKTFGNQKLSGIAIFWGTEINFVNFKNVQVITNDAKLDILKRFFNNRKVHVKVFDSKEQLKMLYAFLEIQCECVISDPKVADWLLEPEDMEKSIVSLVVNYTPKNEAVVQPITEYPKSGSLGLFATSSTPPFTRAGLEAYVTYYIMDCQYELFNDKLLQTFKVEMDTIKCLVAMEIKGLGINKEKMTELLTSVRQHASTIEKQAHKLAGKKFSLSSSKEVSKVLGLTAKESTDKQTLGQLKNPLSDLIICWRKLSHTISTIILPVLEAAKKNRIYGICISRTSTGRISMQEPNLQCIPRNFNIDLENGTIDISLRSCFVPCEGYTFISADFCQLELRILAYLADEPALCKIFRSNIDIFKTIAAKLYCITENEVGDELRQHVKQICYGIIYGMGPKALSKHLGTTEDEAQIYMTKFMTKYPKIQKFIEKVIKLCRLHGYVETIGGRKRYLPHINDENSATRSQAERQAVNTAIQGSAADLVKTAMVAVQKAIKEEFNDQEIYLVLHIHDEFLYEVLSQYTFRAAKLIKSAMENSVNLPMPFPVKVKSGSNWGQFSVFDFN